MTPAHPCFLQRSSPQIEISFEPKAKASVFLPSYPDSPSMHHTVSAASQFGGKIVHVPLADRPVATEGVVKCHGGGGGEQLTGREHGPHISWDSLAASDRKT